MDIQELLRANLGLVERLVRFVCQRSRVVGADVDDFDSMVKLALIDNDYAVLRAWQGRSSLATYLTVVIQRLLADERNRTQGRFRASSRAKELGEDAIRIETLLRRDAMSVAEVSEISRLDPSAVEGIATQLPARTPHPRLVELDEGTDVVASERADAYELQQLSDRASHAIREVIDGLPVRDRMLVRLRFVRRMNIADVARVLQLPQRPLYRRLEQILGILRGALARAGIDGGSAADLIGSAVVALDFGLSDGKNGKNGTTCQSNGEGGQA